MSKKNGTPHVFEDGDLVCDTRDKETFVYNQQIDGKRAARGALRPATAEEKKAFEQFNHPTKP